MVNKYVLDTNVIFRKFEIINLLEDCEIHIPAVVLEEVDKHKHDDDIGHAARSFSRYIDKLHDNNYITEEGNKVFFHSNKPYDLMYLGGYSNDNAIIHVAKMIGATLITDDINVRVKARTIAKIDCKSSEDFEYTFNNCDDEYKGYINYYLDDETINSLYKTGYAPIELIQNVDIYPHMFIIFDRFSGKSGSIIGKVSSDKKSIEIINKNIDSIRGVKYQNVEQLMLMHLLLDDEIELVTVEGEAGSGKTLLTAAAALLLTIDKQLYNKIVFSKPHIDMGKELGILPGNEDEKLLPYMQSFYDALEHIYGTRTEMLEALQGLLLDTIFMSSINYLRGRTHKETFYVLDEGQNTTKTQSKTVLTRAGIGSKYIIMGDVTQIDDFRLSRVNNGLVYIKNNMKDSPLAGHITLTECVRSPLASEAVKRLK